MERILLSIFALIFFCFPNLAQENRTYDGSGNNLQNTDWGATHTQLRRYTTNGYADGISSPGGFNRPNPRIISNALFAQDSLFNDPRQLSDFIWVFGQFIDHDISLTGDSDEPAMVPVPAGDPWFDPFGQGTALIFMQRSEPMDGTGTDISNPREHGNEITAWLDASNVYGSDEVRANWLRTFEDGKMRVSSANLLPFNTFNSNYASPIDWGAPAMDDAVGLSNYHFVAGDPRANENPLLIAFHTLFVREHNRLCDTLKIDNPNWSDEQLYQHARKIVGGQIQHVVFSEWLPTMGVELPPYTGYDENIDPRILNVFSAAAFRMGHTLLNSTLLRLDNDGNEIPAGHLQLQEAFFNPLSIIWSGGGIDPLFKGMGTQIQQDLDCKVINDVRNFLFGPPGAGGLDLASININRGRERGLPDFNTVRADFGLAPYASFLELNPDTSIANGMEQLYGNINNIDPWVGMLSEGHMPDALFGETIMEIMKFQFGALRDGDRFYFENDPALSQEEIDEIKNSNLHDIIMRNTGITLMQQNVFEAMPHDDICDPINNSGIVGLITDEFGEQVENVEILLETGATTMTTNLGVYDLDVANCIEHTISLSRNDNPANGVTALDLAIIRKHILNIELITSPFNLIAGDVNGSKDITTFDMVHIQQVILGQIPEFPNGPSWQFFEEGFTFDDPNDPFATTLPNNEFTFSINSDTLDLNFMAIKIGDVNNSAMANLIANQSETRNVSTLFFDVKDKDVTRGETVDIYLNPKEALDLMTFQFTMNYDSDVLTFLDLDSDVIEDFDPTRFAVFDDRGAVTVSYDGDLDLEETTPILHFTFEAKQEGRLSELLFMNSRITKVEAFSKERGMLDLNLNFIGENENVSSSAFKLFQNQPNPFNATTEISFYLPESSEIELNVFDLSGKVLTTQRGNFNQGFQTIRLNENDFKKTGVFYYQLQTQFGTLTKKMVRIK